MERETNEPENFDGGTPERQLTWAEQEAQNSAPESAGGPAAQPFESQSFGTESFEAPTSDGLGSIDNIEVPGSISDLDADPRDRAVLAKWDAQPSEQPDEVLELVESGPKKSPKLKQLLTAGVAVVVLGAGSMVAVKQYQSSEGTANGVASPEAAVTQFFDSLGNEDFLGAAELMEPTERRTMVNPGIEMVGELKRLGVVADGMDLAAVPGIDMQFDNMSYVPQSLGGNGDIVRVQVNGTVTTAGDAAQLPYGSLITDNVPADVLAEMTSAGEEAMEDSVESIDDLGVVAVQRDGGWYVSLWYSVAEGIRRDSNVEGLPAFGQGPTPTGGETPEDAVWALATAAENLSVSEMIGAMDPQEAAALYDYANLFLAEAQAEIDSEVAKAGTTVDVTRIDMRSETDGDSGQVWVDGMAFEVSVDGEQIKVDTAAECIVEIVSAGSCEISSSDMDEMGMAGTLSQDSSIRVHRVDGRWYLSPMATIMEPMLEQVRNLEKAQLQGWIDDPESLFDEGGPIGGLGLLPLGILGSSATSSFEEVSSAVDDDWKEGEWEEGEWEEDGEWVDADDEWDVPPVSTTVDPFADFDPNREENPTATTSSVPAFTFETPPVGTETTVPPTTPDTTVPVTAVPGTTVAPTTTVAIATTVVIFIVNEPAPAGTSAYSLDADPVEVSPEEAAEFEGALTEDQAGSVYGWVTLTAVEPGDVLRYEWFADE